ncbi:jg8920 [Pararge aegeria aegeria]|uniref:Jg8920 protein n=1 Tax=Pararge aegeria aegeria TaxID=348720 RepID=A0A8S4SJL9_9NEOP|nr:jg8920 [Pararge aegeria aegeria]
MGIQKMERALENQLDISVSCEVQANGGVRVSGLIGSILQDKSGLRARVKPQLSAVRVLAGILRESLFTWLKHTRGIVGSWNTDKADDPSTVSGKSPAYNQSKIVRYPRNISYTASTALFPSTRGVGVEPLMPVITPATLIPKQQYKILLGGGNKLVLPRRALS